MFANLSYALGKNLAYALPELHARDGCTCGGHLFSAVWLEHDQPAPPSFDFPPCAPNKELLLNDPIAISSPSPSAIPSVSAS
jgi:hypothetical protein